jgi:phosphoglycolate phosphatase
MLKLIVLDWDDTIIRDASGAYYKYYATAIEQNGITIDFETVKAHVRKFWGRPQEVVIESLIGPAQPQLSAVIRSYEELFSTDAFSDSLELIDDAKEALLSLKGEYTLAIATGASASVVERLIPHFGLENVFSSIISSSQLEDPARGKPYPDMLLTLLKEFAVQPSEAIVVGDATTDVFMAQAAGVIPVLVLTGQLSKEEADGLNLKYVIPSIADLPDLLSTLT